MTLRPDIDINGINEALVLKADTDFGNIPNNVKYIVESWQSGTSWYRIWNDGWIEQGGVVSNTTRTTAVTFHKAFTTTNYNIQTTLTQCATDWSATVSNGVVGGSKTTTGFTLQTWYNSSNTTGKNDWYACGY
jgi:hypothetical protein